MFLHPASICPSWLRKAQNALWWERVNFGPVPARLPHSLAQREGAWSLGLSRALSFLRPQVGLPLSKYEIESLNSILFHLLQHSTLDLMWSFSAQTYTVVTQRMWYAKEPMVKNKNTLSSRPLASVASSLPNFSVLQFPHLYMGEIILPPYGAVSIGSVDISSEHLEQYLACIKPCQRY